MLQMLDRSQRNTHYALTDEEALALKNDSRVLDVAIPTKMTI